MKSNSKQPVHENGLVSLAPVIQTTPEIRVLFNQFVKQRGYSNLGANELANKFYDWYNATEDKRKVWVENVHSGSDSYRDEHLHPRLKRKVESIEGGRFILDVGCGTGEAVIPYLKPSQHYLGVDSSRYCLEQASERYGIKIADDMNTNPNDSRLLRIGALPDSIPFGRKEFFDEAIASMVLHHVPDYKKSVSSIMGLLQPGANYFIVTFDSDAREQIEKGFEKVKQRTKRKTTGDFNLPRGKLKNETIYFHDNEELHRELQKHSDFIHAEQCAGIFQIFEGIKNRG